MCGLNLGGRAVVHCCGVEIAWGRRRLEIDAGPSLLVVLLFPILQLRRGNET